MSDFLLSVPGRLKTVVTNVNTLLARWTQTKADYIDVATSTRAPAGTALDNTIWTNARAAKLDFLDGINSAAAANGINPVLNPINQLVGIANTAGLVSLTLPAGITDLSPVTAVAGSTYYPVINITGAGVISYLDVGIFSGASGLGGFRLTLDGVAMTQANISGNSAGNVIFGTVSSTGVICLEAIPFRTQFKLEITSAGAGTQFRSRVRYRRTA